MTRNNAALFLMLCVTAIVSAQENEFRKWQMRDGRRTRQPMTVAEIDGRVVSLKREGSDRLTRIVISSLSDADQAFLKEHFPQEMSGRSETASNASPSAASAQITVAGEVRWPAAVVTDDNLEEWVTFIRPTEEDLKWRDIRWHNNLATAQEEARRLQRPILLWTMNGNPCGET
ncbi:MAG: hypothetical protein H8E66_23200 [Planctomycetes bacterium]|nr:hypothetical protein [Planctomycetota bacterium]